MGTHTGARYSRYALALLSPKVIARALRSQSVGSVLADDVRVETERFKHGHGRVNLRGSLYGGRKITATGQLCTFTDIGHVCNVDWRKTVAVRPPRLPPQVTLNRSSPTSPPQMQTDTSARGTVASAASERAGTRLPGLTSAFGLKTRTRLFFT